MNYQRTPFESLLPGFGNVRRELERAFAPVAAARCGSVGAVSVWQDQSHIVIEVDVPGLGQSDLELRLEDGKLWIRGERKAQRESFDFNDRAFGRFERGVVLPEQVDPASIDASLDAGVLRVELSIKPEAQPHVIPIRTKGAETVVNPAVEHSPQA